MNRNDELEARIEALVSREDYRPVKPKVIAKRLKVPEEELREFKRSIKRLIKSGRIMWGAKHLVMRAPENATSKKKSNDALGRIKITRKGFGVVNTDPATPNLGSVSVHIPSQSCLDAVSGDLVKIRILRKRPGRDIEWGGRVLEVVERRTSRFVGTYLEEVDWGYVQVDGTEFYEPIAVGDAGAKGVRPGDKVVIEMVRFPTVHREGEGVIVEVLGPQGKPGVDTQLIMSQYGLVSEFPEAVMKDARRQADQFDETIGQDRRDLTEETIITIDPKDARDFDDAISLHRIKNGHWRLGVHIADVSHFVRPNTALDNEAYDRGTSAYLPDRVIPMLPEIISNNLASLQPDRIRYAMSAFIEFTEDGARVSTEVMRTAIQSKRRFSYEEVDDFLSRPVAWRRKLKPEVHDLLSRMHKLAMILRARRNRDGAIELHLPEVKIDLDGKGKVSGASVSEHTESHQIIEEFMLAANEAVAEVFVDQELPFLRRVHPQPDPQKLEQLTDFVQGLGIDCDHLASRFEIQRLVNKVRNLPQNRAVNLAILRSMSKARYSPDEEGHYALGSNAYCHFTSPIRRYPDLVIHRMVGALADGKRPAVDQQQLARIGDDCSAREENAERAERDLIKLKLLGYFSDKVGKRMQCVITGVRQAGFFAEGVDLPVDGFVSRDALPRDKYIYDSQSHSLNGYRDGNQFRMGDQLQLRIARVDLNRRELDFEVEEGRPSGGGRRPAKHERSPSKSRRPTKSKNSKSENSTSKNSKGRKPKSKHQNSGKKQKRRRNS